MSIQQKEKKILMKFNAHFQKTEGNYDCNGYTRLMRYHAQRKTHIFI